MNATGTKTAKLDAQVLSEGTVIRDGREYVPKRKQFSSKDWKALENAYYADLCFSLMQLVLNPPPQASAQSILDTLRAEAEIPFGDLTAKQHKRIKILPVNDDRTLITAFVNGTIPKSELAAGTLLSADEWLQKDGENYWAGLGAPEFYKPTPIEFAGMLEAAEETTKLQPKKSPSPLDEKQTAMRERNATNRLQRSVRAPHGRYGLHVASPEERKEWARRSVAVRAANRLARQTPTEREEEKASMAEWLRVVHLSPMDRSREDSANELRRAGWIVDRPLYEESDAAMSLILDRLAATDSGFMSTEWLLDGAENNG